MRALLLPAENRSRVGRGLRRAADVALTLLMALPRPSAWRLGREMWRMSQHLDARMTGAPLPLFLAGLTPTAIDLTLPPARVRRLADAIAVLHIASPLGICLRRSLLRYHFLRRCGTPVTIVFGARRRGEALGGHAWLTLDQHPYFEAAEDYQPFVVMVRFPPEDVSAPASGLS